MLVTIQKSENLFINGGSENLYCLLWKSVWCFLAYLGIDLLQDQLCHSCACTQMTRTYYRCTYSSMVIGDPLITAGSWKQPYCPTMDKWIMKMWLIYTVGYYSLLIIFKLENPQDIGYSWQKKKLG